MKKITLLMALVFSSSLMFAQVALTEDFEADSTFPTASGWTVQDLSTPPNGEVWTIDNTGEAGGFTAGNTLVYDNGGFGNYATMDSDGYGNNGTIENTTLTSPSFDCSSLTSVTLSFDTVYNGNFGGQGFIDVFNGTTWVTIQTYATAAADTPNTTVTGTQTFDVPELAGVSNAQVRFRFTGNWSISWSVDNISVFQCTVAPPAAVSAINPMNGATDVDINYGTTTNNLGPIEWSEAPTADSYNISLGTNLAGDDIGVITGFASGNSINFNWQPNTTYYWFIEAVNCAGTTASPVFSFTTSACTDTTAPGLTSAPSPSDGAMDVTIDANGNALAFSWTGDPNASYTVNFGTTNPPTQSFDNFEPGESITGLAENTTYFWSVDALNCFGTTTGTVWSFTTGLALSVTENEISKFSIYPNPVIDIVNIKSTNSIIDNIQIFDLSGKMISNYGSNDILDSQIDLSNLSKGIYLMKISAGDKTQTLKINKN
ncbi:T9SS type A sorting domain-containing protein [Winogradskyella algicola]|uniref:T9SS type A sorting domain-containing protein n=1 Tax=Winogradskyella algicola TaxID=2575815 RepID=UPI001109BA80|nr:T9SS type A sorting domain-containing protein [Winogradskyella algicola]